MTDKETKQTLEPTAYKPEDKRLKEQLPKVVTLQGFHVRLTNEDLETIEELVSIGAKAAYVAYVVGISEDELHTAVNNSVRVETAIKRGQARDEQELNDRVRQMAMKGNIAAAVWYQKNKHGWHDNKEKGPKTAAIIQVNTGISRDSGPDSLDITVIEGPE